MHLCCGQNSGWNVFHVVYTRSYLQTHHDIYILSIRLWLLCLSIVSTNNLPNIIRLWIKKGVVNGVSRCSAGNLVCTCVLLSGSSVTPTCIPDSRWLGMQWKKISSHPVTYLYRVKILPYQDCKTRYTMFIIKINLWNYSTLSKVQAIAQKPVLTKYSTAITI